MRYARRRARSVLAAGAWLGIAAAPAAAADPPTPAAAAPVRSVTPESRLLQELAADPSTAPYQFRVTRLGQGRQYALTGRVGSRAVHDVAVRKAIDLGIPVRDDLVIDTNEAYRAAAQAPAAFVSAPYVYPQPILGRLDNPFYGMEPPTVSYSPWFGAVAAREPIRLPGVGWAALPPGVGDPGPAVPLSAPNGVPGTVQVDVDVSGQVVLQGTVATAEEREAIERKLARTPGVTRVVNELQVAPGGVANGNANANPTPGDVPPPPPRPAFRPPPPPAPALPREETPAVQGAPVRPEGDDLGRRVTAALARRPALAATGVRAAARDGVVTLAGEVPSAYEAMLAFRAAQQTPGVTDVVDRLRFTPPEEAGPNPLRDKARPDDLAPYLLSHVRRQLGGLAHVDRVEPRGDTLEIVGTVADRADTPRVEAALRSIPLLRGFRVEPKFLVD